MPSKPIVAARIQKLPLGVPQTSKDSKLWDKAVIDFPTKIKQQEQKMTA
jgi:hypothetical protein